MSNMTNEELIAWYVLKIHDLGVKRTSDEILRKSVKILKQYEKREKATLTSKSKPDKIKKKGKA